MARKVIWGFFVLMLYLMTCSQASCSKQKDAPVRSRPKEVVKVQPKLRSCEEVYLDGYNDGASGDWEQGNQSRNLWQERVNERKVSVCANYDSDDDGCRFIYETAYIDGTYRRNKPYDENRVSWLCNRLNLIQVAQANERKAQKNLDLQKEKTREAIEKRQAADTNWWGGFFWFFALLCLAISVWQAFARITAEIEGKKAEDERAKAEAEEGKAKNLLKAKEMEAKNAEERRLTKQAEGKLFQDKRLELEAEQKKTEDQRRIVEANAKQAEEVRKAQEAQLIAAEVERQNRLEEYSVIDHVNVLISRLDQMDGNDIRAERGNKYLDLYEKLKSLLDKTSGIPFARREQVIMSVKRLNQIETVNDLYAEKIQQIKRDESIDDELKGLKVEKIKRLWDTDISQLGGK